MMSFLQSLGTLIIPFETLVFSCAVTSIFVWLARVLVDKSINGERLEYFILVLTIAVLGGVAGYAGGLSRIGVVGDVIPAALSLVGGLSIYIFGINKERNVSVALLVVCFALSLFITYALSANLRADGEKYQKIVEYCTKIYGDPAIYKDQQILNLANTVNWDMCGPAIRALTER